MCEQFLWAERGRTLPCAAGLLPSLRPLPCMALPYVESLLGHLPRPWGPWRLSLLRGPTCLSFLPPPAASSALTFKATWGMGQRRVALVACLLVLIALLIALILLCKSTSRGGWVGGHIGCGQGWRSSPTGLACGGQRGAVFGHFRQPTGLRVAAQT